MAPVMGARATAALPVQGSTAVRPAGATKAPPNGVLPVELQNNISALKGIDVVRKGASVPCSGSRPNTDPGTKRMGPDHGDRPGFAGGRRAALVWFRNDLRLDDNEALAAANREASSLLPVFCFDPRDFSQQSQGIAKTGPYRANFLLESVADLRQRLRDCGSDLIVRMGKPEEVLMELAQQMGASAVYCQGEVTGEEMAVEERVQTALGTVNANLKRFWGSTLFHIEDLPFKLDAMPGNFGDFRGQMWNQRIRPPVEAPQQLRDRPAAAHGLDAGQLPTLEQLGVSGPAPAGIAALGGTLIGGEAEGLSRLAAFVRECGVRAAGHAEKAGVDFSSKVSPWLAMGCITPRRLYAEVASSPAATSASCNPDPTDTKSSLAFLLAELTWRDFFRFITKKYAMAPKQQVASAQHNAALAIPSAACASKPALALV